MGNIIEKEWVLLVKKEGKRGIYVDCVVLGRGRMGG